MSENSAKEPDYCPVHPKRKLDHVDGKTGSCFKCYLRYDLKEARKIIGFCQRNGFRAKQILVKGDPKYDAITWGLPPGGLKHKELIIVHKDGSELTDEELEGLSI